MLGLGSNMMKHPVTGKSIVRDGLVLQHNYNLSSVEPLSSGAASFDGTDDYIALGASNSLVTGTNVTLACWFQLLDTDNAYLFQNQKGSASSNIFLRLNSDGHGFIGAGVWNGSSHAIISFDGNVDTTNSWHHIACVTTSSAQVLYLDGVAVATGAATFVNAASSDQSTLGSINGASNFFKGYMANMGVWSAALSQAQIKSIMNKNYDSLSASEKTDLVSWWNLDSVIPETTTLVYDNHHGGGEILGGELVDDGDFSLTGTQPASTAGTYWSTGSKWTISGGKAVLESTTSGGSTMSQSSVFTVGELYKITLDAEVTAGSAKIEGSGGATALTINTTKTYEFYWVASITSLVFNRISGTTSATISNISVKQVNGNTGTLS